MSELERQIVSALRRNQALSVPEVARIVGATNYRARTAITALVLAGTVKAAGVTYSGARCYVLTTQEDQ